MVNQLKSMLMRLVTAANS